METLAAEVLPVVTLQDKLDASSTRVGDCLIWGGDIYPYDGYGRIFWQGKNRRVHRARYADEHPDEPELTRDDIIMHTCHNPLCNEPSHLVRGTHLQNMEMMRLSGRSRKPKGISCPKRPQYAKVLMVIASLLGANNTQAGAAAGPRWKAPRRTIMIYKKDPVLVTLAEAALAAMGANI